MIDDKTQIKNSLNLIRNQCIMASGLAMIGFLFAGYAVSQIDCMITQEQWRSDYSKTFSSVEDYSQKCHNATNNVMNFRWVLLAVIPGSLINYLYIKNKMKKELGDIE